MRLERILIFLMVLSIFLDDFIIGGTDSTSRRASSFDFYYYYLIWISFIIFAFSKTRKFTFLPRWLLISLVILFSASIFSGLSTDNVRFGMIKQMIGIVFTGVAFYTLFVYTSFDIKKLFSLYLLFAFYVSIIGIIDEILMLRGVHHIFENVKRVSLGLYRVYSIMGEPYFLAVALIPAVYYYMHEFFRTKFITDQKTTIRFSVIFLCYIFTFSSAGIFGLGLMILILLYDYGYFSPTNPRFLLLLLLTFVVLPQLGISDKFSLKELEIRAADSYKAFSAAKPLDKEEVADLNSSTFALYSNYIIAQQSFRNNPLFGCGLGNHEKVYDEYFESKFGTKFKIMYGNFNAKDANSLFIRLMSEGGLLGLSMITLLWFRFFLGRKYFRMPDYRYYTILNQSVFIVIFIRLIRTGNYIGQGFFFFIFLYYLTWKLVRSNSAKSIKSLPESTANSPTLS